MAEKLTPQQQMVVDDRGGNLLVSAAAGSGKTKVLVDRLLSYITGSDGRINIDDFLIITFTQAAAAELRSKIAEKLNERLSDDPGNRHLQRQIQRLYLAKISTVHSFCADILREYAYRLDIPGDFRMADERECNALKIQVLDRVLEKAYEDGDEDFMYFMDSQELERNDNSIPQLILKVYKSAWCHIDPKGWLDYCLQSSDVVSANDVSQTILGKYLIDDFHEFLDYQIHAFLKCENLAKESGSMPKVVLLLQDTLYQLKILRSFDRWDDIVNHNSIDFGRLDKPKDCPHLNVFEKIKLVRNNAKEAILKKLTIFSDQSEQVLRDLSGCSASMRGLICLVNRFSVEYSEAKRVRHILDFGDLEHRMLDLLLGKKRQGRTTAADEIGNRFVEIMVDEYQDTNAVQDAIFSALTHKRNNLFMVGDVKQSIYQFRLADPTIFLDKYHTYIPAENAQPGQGRKIMLSRNFRSSGDVIHAVNDVFAHCMSNSVGGLVYDQDVQLYEGIPHISLPEPDVEFCAIDVQDDTYSEEAEYVASRIEQLLDGNHYVRNGETMRPIVAEDIVILLRAPKSTAADFQYALAKHNIRSTSESSVDLLQTEEIGFIRSLLQVIHNPLQDIPLIAALTSKVLCFSADDLASIRASSPRSFFFDSLTTSQMQKATDFVCLLHSMRNYAKISTVSQIVDRVLAETRLEAIFSAMEDGQLRMSNLQSFYHLIEVCEETNITNLGQFLDYLDTLDEEGLAPASEESISGAVLILSIHKSKGLEYPVVFLCGLSREFNFRHLNEQVLCQQELGIGLNCLDLKNRVRYPSVAKKALRIKMRKETISEEIRLLYVAMTRARDRLIMTYADNKLSATVSSLAMQMDICDKEYMMSSVTRPGTWVMLSALQRTESGSLFAIGEKPDNVFVSEHPWKVITDKVIVHENDQDVISVDSVDNYSIIDTQILGKTLNYKYPHLSSTTFPSKQTATQIKGRYKDFEAAENTETSVMSYCTWRNASFATEAAPAAASRGTAVHTVMQHLSFAECTSDLKVQNEINRIIEAGYISEELGTCIDASMIMRFFMTDLGRKLQTAHHVLREFKFSVLDAANHYHSDMKLDQVLLQGVVDCAIIEENGIIILDFKTDHVTDDTVMKIADNYRPQVLAYAGALSRIFDLPVQSAVLYFFKNGATIPVI